MTENVALDEDQTHTRLHPGSGAAAAPAVTVVVRNLPIGTSAAELRALCEHVGEVVEVEIPSRTELFTEFMFGFVRFADLETARAAVRRLSGGVLGSRRLRAQIARDHWRNTNEVTVPRASVQGGLDEDEEEEQHAEGSTRSLTEKVYGSSGIHRKILRECRWQWNVHRKHRPDRDLPSFESILETAFCLSDESEATLEEDQI